LLSDWMIEKREISALGFHEFLLYRCPLGGMFAF
jgi:hypothetical protein